MCSCAVVINTIIVVITLIESFSSKGAPKHVFNVFVRLVLTFADVCMFCFVISVACYLVGGNIPFITGLRVRVL